MVPWLQPGSVGPSLSSPGLARTVANSQGFLPGNSQLQPGPIMSSQPGLAMNIANPQSNVPLQSDLVAMNIANSSRLVTPPTSRAYGSNGSCNDSVSSIGSITIGENSAFCHQDFWRKLSLME